MALPDPQPGMVIRYAYLWHDEHRRGQEEGRKDRPCVVIMSAIKDQGEWMVTVAPVTHTAPRTLFDAVEIPIVTKQRLGLDDARSWVIVSEVNRFIWPGSDLRPVHHDRPGEFVYGYLPPKLFHNIKQSLLNLARAMQLKAVRRVE